jgi:cyclophilin family peptidyl-prolyl cis-trans isomerase
MIMLAPFGLSAEVQCLLSAGVLSMGRWDDPNSGKSSFSFLLGNAPHLDMQYTIFG